MMERVKRRDSIVIMSCYALLLWSLLQIMSSAGVLSRVRVVPLIK